MKKVKITVLERTYNKELAEKYGVENLPRCPINQEGRVFIYAGGKPEGLCDEAWTCFEKYVFALSHEVKEFWGDWIPSADYTINSCNDGLRPVIFKLEKMDEDI